MAGTIITVYGSLPNFPASQNNPSATRYVISGLWVDAVGGEPTVGEVAAYLSASVNRAPAMNFQCSLEAQGPTLLVLKPKFGSQVFIDGVNRPIFDTAGAYPSIANTGLAANTFLYVYAKWVEPRMMLEFSTTGYTDSALYGHPVLTGDATKSLVGIIRTGPGTPGEFLDNDAQRFVASYYNRINKPAQRTALTGTPSTTSATYVELTAGDKVEFIAWGEEWSNCWHNSAAINATVGNICGGGIGVNGATTVIAPNLFNQPAAGVGIPVSGNTAYKFAPGYNYINYVGKSSGGTVATFVGANSGYGAMLRQ
jgi:hypothetical protein